MTSKGTKAVYDDMLRQLGIQDDIRQPGMLPTVTPPTPRRLLLNQERAQRKLLPR